jgi:hypothetical protein
MRKRRLWSAISGLQEIKTQPGRPFFVLIHFFHYLIRLFHLRGFSKYFRYLEISTIPFKRFQDDSDLCANIEVLFVSTAKDFHVLRSAVKFAIKATSQYNLVEFVVLVPDHEAELCNSLFVDLDVSVTVIKESFFVSEEIRENIKDRYGTRTGWVLQQVLKNLYVLSSKAPGVLIVDSDTLLLEKRNWLSASGKQILLPTWEYHFPYYRFLHSRQISERWPKFTFVSHHMMMQPSILTEAFNAAGWSSLEDLIETLVAIQKDGEESPFCIEYELYGQYILKKYPHLVVLEKWSNTSFARASGTELQLEQEVLDLFGDRFASVSLHSYLQRF